MKKQLEIVPKEGRLVIFSAVEATSHYQANNFSTWRSEPVKKGSKYIGHVYLHKYEFKKAHLWSCTDRSASLP